MFSPFMKEITRPKMKTTWLLQINVF